MKCTACSGELESGYFVDNDSVGQMGFKVYTQGTWIRGKPETKTGFFAAKNALNIKNQVQWPITAYRCINCGHLELFVK